MCIEVDKINDYLNSYKDANLKFAAIYEDRKSRKKYSRTFFKDSSDGKKFYYRVQLLKKNTNEFVLQRDSGTLNVPNNFKELKNLPLNECLKLYNISIWRKNVDSKFACLEKRDRRYKKRLPVRYLLRNIFDLTIVKKVLGSYSIDKKKLSALNLLQGVDENSIEVKFHVIESMLKNNTHCQLIDGKNNQAVSLLDVFYKQLHSKIDVLDKSTERWKLIETCVKNTHSNIHDDYEIHINEIFVVKRWEDRKRFMGKLGNKKLLWHGTRLTNVASILENGFELNPTGVKISSRLMFGKGIYFTNTVSKAANYCGTGTNTRSPRGVLFLCEVALGKMKVTLQPLPNPGQLSEGQHSVFAKGLMTPDKKDKQKVMYNVEFAYGNLIKIPNRISQLHHDEFVVYNPAQIKIRYMVLVNFKYKK